MFFTPLKGAAVLICLKRNRGTKSFGPQIFQIYRTDPPVINDLSLSSFRLCLSIVIV